MHWPRAYGGRGATTAENYILQEELARARAPEIIGRIGVNLVGPTLIHHGSEAQKRRHLPKILAAEELWCQLFSEPNAGSDLAALRCRAERRGDEFVVTGQKVWTSYAQFADWGILLARTDPGAPNAKAISFLIVDMHSPGITIRPLQQMTGGDEFNEVFLEEVRVPVENLVGALHQGWSIAQTTLSHERGTSPRQLVVHRILLGELLALARATGAADDPLIRQQLAQVFIEVELTKLHNWRTLTQLRRHGKPGPESSLVKLFWSEMSQRLHDTAMQVLGVQRPVLAGRAARRRARPLAALLSLLPRRHHLRRHLRGAAQHHRPARPRPAALSVPTGCGIVPCRRKQGRLCRPKPAPAAERSGARRCGVAPGNTRIVTVELLFSGDDVCSSRRRRRTRDRIILDWRTRSVRVG